MPSETLSRNLGLAREGMNRVLFAACHVVMLAAYAWVAHLATVAPIPARTDYYDQQAVAFQQGHLYLDTQPSPTLLALPDPYDPSERAGVPYMLDASLFRGRYYLYFGPVPGLLLLAAKAVYAGTIGDLYLVFLFAYGIFFVQSLLLVRLWKRYFSEVSQWLVAASMLLVGLISPYTWVLARPDVYSVAITAGQLFLLAGIYAAWQSLEKGAQPYRLAITGLLWAAAIGSRFTLILPAGFLVVILGLAVARGLRDRDSFGKALWRLSALALGFAIGLAALGRYNAARFGSPLETGLTYQLAGPDLRAGHSLFFSPAYVIQNLYNYSVQPPHLSGQAPFMFSAVGRMKTLFGRIAVPRFYHAQRVTGLLYTGPFLILGILPVIALVTRRAPFGMDNTNRGLRWLVAAMYGVFIINTAFFMAFFWAAERYLLDFIPCWVLLSVIGFCQLDRLASRRQAPHALLVAAAIMLMAISIAVSILLVLGSLPLEY